MNVQFKSFQVHFPFRFSILQSEIVSCHITRWFYHRRLLERQYSFQRFLKSQLKISNKQARYFYCSLEFQIDHKITSKKHLMCFMAVTMIPELQSEQQTITKFGQQDSAREPEQYNLQGMKRVLSTDPGTTIALYNLMQTVQISFTLPSNRRTDNATGWVYKLVHCYSSSIGIKCFTVRGLWSSCCRASLAADFTRPGAISFFFNADT